MTPEGKEARIAEYHRELADEAGEPEPIWIKVGDWISLEVRRSGSGVAIDRIVGSFGATRTPVLFVNGREAIELAQAILAQLPERYRRQFVAPKEPDPPVAPSIPSIHGTREARCLWIPPGR